ncbi:MAG: DUF2089 domain-containing protein [Blautia sp.]|jgi:hypothetical protein
MKKIISRCPVCGGELKVTRLKCAQCDTILENDFTLSKFDYLSAEELYFTETFIRCRGNIKEVEKELGISYPTVRSKLDSIIQTLGYGAQDTPDEEMRRRESILKAVEQGSITVEEAIRQLK